MKYRQTIGLLLGLLLWCGCDDFKGDKRFSENKYILSGLLYEGRTVDNEHPIFIGKSVTAEGGNVTDMFLDNPEVRLRDITENTERNLSFYAAQISDTEFKLGFIDNTQNPLLITEGHRYKIIAVTGADSLWAETLIPANVQALPDSGWSYNSQAPYPNLRYEEISREHPVIITAPNTDIMYFFAEFYCLNDDYTQAEYVNPFLGHDKPKDADEYEDPVTQEPRKISTFGSYQPRYRDDLPQPGYYINVTTHQAGFVFYGPYRVKFKLIDQNYYKYLYKEEGYRFGGVHNGYGYFGSACEIIFYTNIVE